MTYFVSAEVPLSTTDGAGGTQAEILAISKSSFSTSAPGLANQLKNTSEVSKIHPFRQQPTGITKTNDYSDDSSVSEIRLHQ